MSKPDDAITLREAAEYVTHRRPEPDVLEEDRPANQPGAEATAALDAMLAASRHGRIVRKRDS